jgi:demethylmenaquinone methyltransferase/2-methoxy-6-polyprenyl-1,4-benzoquinol methylase
MTAIQNSKLCEIYSKVQVYHDGHAKAKQFFNSSTARSYDSVVRITTFGRDAAWKRHVLAGVRNKKRVLDLACGTGILSKMVGLDRTVGLDLTFEYLQVANSKMRLACVQATAEAIPYRDGMFDAVVSSYLAKYVDLKALVDECWRVLEEEGVVIFHDFTRPESQVVHGLWRLYFKILRTTGMVLARQWRNVFSELDKVICQSNWISLLEDELEHRGFTNIESAYYTFGTAGMVVAKKP